MEVLCWIFLFAFQHSWCVDLHLGRHNSHTYQVPPVGDLSPAGPLSPSRDVRIQLKNDQNGQYVGTFTVGGQELPVIYDTGAFGIVVLSDLCHDCRVDGPIYSSSKSLTFQKGQNVDGQHKYEMGTVESKSGEETVRVGDANSPLVGSKVVFWQVFHHNVQHWDKDSKFSGVIGLRLLGSGPTLLADVGVTAFSICLEQASGAPGWFAMGPTVEQARLNPAFKHVPVISNVHWGVQMTSINVAGESLKVCSPSCSAVIDSGASQIGAPKEAMYALAPVFDQIDPECRNLESLPDISFHLGDETFVIPPSTYVVKVEVQGQEKEKRGRALKCVANFVEFNMESKNHGHIWILGIPFLRQYYTVFRHNPKSLDFAHATGNCQPADSPADSSAMAPQRNAFSNQTQRFRGKLTEGGIPILGTAAIRFPKWARDWQDPNGTSMPDF